MEKNYLIIILMVVIILIISLFLFKTSITRPPIIRFTDENNVSVNGEIYLDNVYIGGTVDGKFKNLPKSYCKTTHDLALKTTDATFEWNSYPIDCKFDIVTYSVKIATIKK